MGPSANAAPSQITDCGPQKRPRQIMNNVLSAETTRCEVCGNANHTSFTVHIQGQTRAFDCFECAIQAIAPTCASCGCRIIGHGLENEDSFYCCAHCARQDMSGDFIDRSLRLISKTILAASPVGVAVSDESGTVVFANSQFLRMVGYAVEEIESRQVAWDHFRAPETAEQDDRALARLKQVQVCESYETLLVKKDGSRVPVQIGALIVPEQNGPGRMAATFVTDLTPIKKAEETFRETTSTLDQKLSERATELEKANRQIQDFSYHMSHNLRAPLRAIAGTSRLIQEDFGHLLPQEALTMLARQVNASTTLGRMIDDLVQLASLSQAILVPGRVDMTALANAVCRTVSTPEGRAFDFEVQEGMQATGDASLLRLALLNLVENAVKFSPDGGTVRIGRRADGAFYIEDSGIGISVDYLNKVFEPFHRLHRNDEFSGTGMGLTNVHQIITRHGGEVWAESHPEKGAIFLFTLPESR
jgi:PAS domain S-box-containing protein